MHKWLNTETIKAILPSSVECLHFSRNVPLFAHAPYWRSYDHDEKY